jgi:uncharacterized protein YndB with AHSA1/START domain
MAQTEAAKVRKHVVVDAPIERAFTVFTERFGDFKPPEHNLLGAPIAQTVFEPRVSGSIVDRAVDGSECRWARILAPERVELEHRHIDRHGPGWEAVTSGVDGPEGWPLYLDRYAALVKEGR